MARNVCRVCMLRLPELGQNPRDKSAIGRKGFFGSQSMDAFRCLCLRQRSTRGRNILGGGLVPHVREQWEKGRGQSANIPFKSMFPVPLNNFLWLGTVFQSLHHLLRHLRDSWLNHSIFKLLLYILKANVNFSLGSFFCDCDKTLRSKATNRKMQFVSVYTCRSQAITEGSQVRHSGRIHGGALLVEFLRGSGSPSFPRQPGAVFTGNGTAHSRLGLSTSITMKITHTKRHT